VAGETLLLKDIWAALMGEGNRVAAVEFVGEGALPSRFRVTSLAAASMGAAALSVAELLAENSDAALQVKVDRRLASFWFFGSLKPLDWTPPPPWDAIAGDYETSDGWIRLHTNTPRHRHAALRVLEVPADRTKVADAVRRWEGAALESAMVGAGGCAAEMRTLADWRIHPQGAAVASEALVQRQVRPPAVHRSWRPTAGRPLHGLRVLDLTRILAGPVATRCLAGFGADVLRIDPPGWDEAGVVPEVTLGKRCARLDLTVDADRRTFVERLQGADILVHGYRPGALEDLGFGARERGDLAPHLIEISLNAYGWSGPWAHRRGFDSLVQMSTGIAEAGMGWRSGDKPTPLPVQALDHATGYLMAAAAVRAITGRLRGEGVHSSRLSLARTAELLINAGWQEEAAPFRPLAAGDFAAEVEVGPWGCGRRLRPPMEVEGAPLVWTRPASALGASPAEWL
jgi:crotonobetainyl-CoA:carnitine CoA-transferase CaiB-like acyl-CoA transferase